MAPAFCNVLFSCNILSAQHTEDDIRKLEDLERQAVLQADSNALFNRYWSPGMVVNTRQPRWYGGGYQGRAPRRQAELRLF